MGDDRDDYGEHGAELLRAARRSMSPEAIPRGGASGYVSERGDLSLLASVAESRRGTFGFGRDAAETPGGPDHRAADAADRRNLESFRRIVPPEVFRQVEDLTGAIIAQRHAGDDDMVAFLRESMKILMRDAMSGAGEATPPPVSVGGFTFPNWSFCA